MSTKRSLSGPKSGNPNPTRRSAGKRTLTSKANAQNERLPLMPVEWFGSTNWRLPSGKALAEFALQAGFLAPLLFKTDGPPSTGLASLGSELSNWSRSSKKERRI